MTHTKPRPCLSTILVLLATSLPLGACMSSQLGANVPSSDVATPRGILLTVENQHPQDIRVYLIRGETPIPLGSVRTLERRTFAVSTAILGHSGAVRLIADPLGSTQRHASVPIPAAAGDRVEWRLESNLKLSSFTVR